jgi:hypothetical protein
MFEFFRTIFDVKRSYHTTDSKLMLQLMEDRVGYSVLATAFIKERIRTFEKFGYPTYGIY